MNICPLCGGPHELSQCPRWRVPSGFVVATLYLCAPWLIPVLASWHLNIRMGALLP